ncbi:hypothetical protein HDU76_008948, partial [Blyttiomyces sp. JEL0837]
SYLNVRPILPPSTNTGEGPSVNPNKRQKPDDIVPTTAQPAVPSYSPPRHRYNLDLEDDTVSVASESSQSSQVQQPYYPSAFGQPTGPYHSAFRKPYGKYTVPEVLDHQRRSDHWIQKNKTHEATANYTAKFNTTFNVTQGSATPPNPENVLATLQTVESTQKFAEYQFEQFKQQQKREKRQQFQPPRESAHERINRLESYNASLEQTLIQYNNYFTQIGEDIKKVRDENATLSVRLKYLDAHSTQAATDIQQNRWAFDLLFEELSRSTLLLDRVAEKAGIPTYTSVLNKEILDSYIGTRNIDEPLANAAQIEPFYRHHEYFDQDTAIPDANP